MPLAVEILPYAPVLGRKLEVVTPLPQKQVVVLAFGRPPQ
jgi:hypothetical protein